MEWIRHTHKRISDLPQAVLDAIAKDFAGYKLEEIEKSEAPGKPLVYEAELEKGEVTYEVQFSADGQVISKKRKKAIRRTNWKRGAS